MSSASKSGKSSRISAVETPSASISKTSCTRIRSPRMQGFPPSLPSSIVIRFRRSYMPNPTTGRRRKRAWRSEHRRRGDLHGLGLGAGGDAERHAGPQSHHRQGGEEPQADPEGQASPYGRAGQGDNARDLGLVHVVLHRATPESPLHYGDG